MKTSILLVDDEQAFLDSMERMLRLERYKDVTTAVKSTEVPAMCEQREFDVAFLDISMPELDGLSLLKKIKEVSPATECIMVTANESIPKVITAMKRGAYDYLVKPVVPGQVTHALDRALERKRLLESSLLHSEAVISRMLKNPDAFTEIVTTNDAMVRLLHEAELHAGSNIPVLITGETGCGKELMARAVHMSSPRAAGPLVAVNMLSLSPTLFESEFFGHVKGAFTGADKDKAGYLSKANGGTLFLDEIGDLSLEIQGKLLRILQEGEFTPVGKTRPEMANVRFVAATNHDLKKQVEEKKFRKDLFYRLQYAQVHLPPLRERMGDVPVLAARFVLEGTRLTDGAMDALAGHDWPGNVRELKGVLAAATNLADGKPIDANHLRLPNAPKARKPVTGTKLVTGELETMADVERRHILAVYDAMGNIKSQTALTLQIGLQTLHRKLKAYGVK